MLCPLRHYSQNFCRLALGENDRRTSDSDLLQIVGRCRCLPFPPMVLYRNICGTHPQVAATIGFRGRKFWSVAFMTPGDLIRTLVRKSHSRLRDEKNLPISIEVQRVKFEKSFEMVQLSTQGSRHFLKRCNL